MIPSRTILETDIQELEIPSRTYKINLNKNRVNGYTDNLDAIKQAVYLILNIERYKFPIYSWDYGIELEDLFGKDSSYVIPELERRISEALLQDDRIIQVSDFDFNVNKNKIHVEFLVTSNLGEFNAETEVNI